MVLASLPSPARAVWHLGPVPLRAYALCIVAGILVAVWLTRLRWKARGGDPDDITDIALWAVPFGIVGGRLYHVITDPELYFTPGKDPVRALFIWDGGLGILGRGGTRRGVCVDRVPAAEGQPARPWRRLSPGLGVGAGGGPVG